MFHHDGGSILVRALIGLLKNAWIPEIDRFNPRFLVHHGPIVQHLPSGGAEQDQSPFFI
nr:hypothetical protein [Pasteuria penetrans]